MPIKKISDGEKSEKRGLIDHTLSLFKDCRKEQTKGFTDPASVFGVLT